MPLFTTTVARMRVRKSSDGSELDTRLLIEERLPSLPACASNRHHKRFLNRHANAVVGILLLLLVFSFWSLQSYLNELDSLSGGAYDATPLSQPQIRVDGSTVYQIGVVTDLDHDSLSGKRWISYFKRGELTLTPDQSRASVTWKDASDKQLFTDIAAGGRAMELSDLVVFNHRLLTVDDRTGLIYEIVNGTAIPWVFLDDGPGRETKPLKGEWMTVKDGELWVGGLGKEWSTPEGEYINDHPMWVKVIDRTGRIRHINWANNYRKVRVAAGIHPPGYMVHESVQWSETNKSWMFLPRRASTKPYDDAADEKRGTNMLVIADDSFDHISMVRVGPGAYEGTRGFSAFQFIPGCDDKLILALKSEEIDGRPAATYITAFDIHGTVILEETPLTGSFKFEGLAFI